MLDMHTGPFRYLAGNYLPETQGTLDQNYFTHHLGFLVMFSFLHVLVWII